MLKKSPRGFRCHSNVKKPRFTIVPFLLALYDIHPIKFAWNRGHVLVQTSIGFWALQSQCYVVSFPHQGFTFSWVDFNLFHNRPRKILIFGKLF